MATLDEWEERDATLKVYGDYLNDLEDLRIRSNNRIHALTSEPIVGEKGGHYGLGIKAEDAIYEMADGLASLEQAAEKHLLEKFRSHPLYYCTGTVGIGAKRLSRFLVAVGHPAYRLTEDGWQPRTLKQLWAYCGWAPGQKLSRGQRATFNPDARKRSWLLAKSCLMATNSPYRQVYLARREHTKTTHPDWTDGHSHNDAMRVMAKQIVADLWTEANNATE